MAGNRRPESNTVRLQIVDTCKYLGTLDSQLKSDINTRITKNLFLQKLNVFSVSKKI